MLLTSGARRSAWRILLTCNQPEYVSLPPRQIVAALADQDLSDDILLEGSRQTG
jgi:hypothetical protein